ncbi:hypothetical protein J6590_063870 [Homalodisca vitripennis]|nr:hypothetical protein J6590_063870 [Homalodisca vitripennis]
MCLCHLQRVTSLEAIPSVIYHDIRRAMDQKKLTILMIVDFIRAFEHVNHMLLFTVLESYNFDDIVLKLCSSYIVDRVQRVKTQIFILSEWRCNPVGVSQGSTVCAVVDRASFPLQNVSLLSSISQFALGWHRLILAVSNNSPAKCGLGILIYFLWSNVKLKYQFRKLKAEAIHEFLWLSFNICTFYTSDIETSPLSSKVCHRSGRQGVEKDLRTIGATLEVAQDRGSWRDIVGEVKNHLGFEWPQE